MIRGGADMLYYILSTITFLIYGSVFIISLIFTISLDAYNKIDEKLNLVVFSEPIITILDANLDFFEVWLKNNNRIAGSVLVFLSVVDLKLFFDIFRNG